jgi:thiol-disulfide isomerase/thioredoxin
MVGTLLRNRPNVLAFVSPDCSHCQTELSVLDRLVASVPNGTGIVVVADALHHSEKELAEFAAEHRNLAVYFDRHRARLQLGFRFVPVIVCVGRDGSVRQIITGERTQEALAAAMRANAS